MKKTTKKEIQKEAQQVQSDVKGLKTLASRLKAAVDTANYPKGYPELKPSVRDSSKLANDILTVVKILKALAKADALAFVHDGRLFHGTEFTAQARHAVFNARLLAAGKKGAL